MTPLQKRIFLALTVVIALTRLFALAASLFEWDEGLFVLGVREFNVIRHYPHPPGYPLYVAAAKAVHLFGVSEFRSLQTIVVLGAMAIFPALFFLARQIGFDFATSAGGAALFAFLPNVWVYGGTAFSDIPSTAIGFLACGLLLRGREDKRAYVVGAIVLGIAAGFRPSNLFLGAVPALLATWRQRRAWKHVLLALFLGSAIAAGSYVGAALASGTIAEYREAVRIQSEWVRKIDSFRNPTRERLHKLTDTFFLYPVAQPERMTGLAAIALISLVAGLVKRRAAPLLTVAIFAPFAITAWLNLDHHFAGRYAIAYLATHALLAADGLGILASRRPRVQAVLCVVVASVFIAWTWPALRLVRSRPSPPAAAIEWAKRQAKPNERIFVSGALGPQAYALMPGDPRLVIFDHEEPALLTSGGAWVVDTKERPGARNFTWPRRNPLWKIVRQRNFEASVSRGASTVAFGEGWFGDEGVFRWMPAESVTALPALPRNGTLRLLLYAPVEVLQPPPAVEVWVNGALLERIIATNGTIDRTWTIRSRSDGSNELRIKTSATMNPKRLGLSGDGRELGLRIDGISWLPAD